MYLGVTRLPASGYLSLSMIENEFLGTTPINLSSYYRNLKTTSNNTNVPTSGKISISEFYNAIRAFTYTANITSNTTNFSLMSAAISAGWDGILPLVATINVSAVIGSTSTGAYAFSDAGSYPTGSSYTLNILSGGYIVGAGGNGGNGGVWSAGGGGAGGGPALDLSGTNITKTIVNNGVIGGGGGGGGGGSGNSWSSGYGGRYGGAGGGGAGYYPGIGGNQGSYPGGSAGAGGTGSTTGGGYGTGAISGGAGGYGGNLGSWGNGGASSQFGGGGGGSPGAASSGWNSVSSYSGAGGFYGPQY